MVSSRTLIRRRGLKMNEEYKERREWYEQDCANGDPKGLKGKKRLEFFNAQEANASLA
jgi:hypothetical protein